MFHATAPTVETHRSVLELDPVIGHVARQVALRNDRWIFGSEAVASPRRAVMTAAIDAITWMADKAAGGAVGRAAWEGVKAAAQAVF